MVLLGSNKCTQSVDNDVLLSNQSFASGCILCGGITCRRLGIFDAGNIYVQPISEECGVEEDSGVSYLPFMENLRLLYLNLV